jgi:hypothetical protein
MANSNHGFMDEQGGDYIPEHDVMDAAQQVMIEGMKSTYYRREDGTFWIIVPKLVKVTKAEVKRNSEAVEELPEEFLK